MAIASVGTLGQATSGVSSSSLNWTTASNALSTSGDLAILTVVSDNITTTDGATNDHTSVTGGNGTWTKLGEYTNGEGSAAAGVTTSQWLFTSTGTNAVGTVFTINFSGAVVDKVAAGWKFTVAAGNSLQASASIVGNATDASNGFGSASHSGLASLSRLYIRSLGKEANTTTGITVSTSFTRFTATARSRNNALAVCTASEFRINTSTGETSNPTLAVSGDTAAVFSALEEYTPSAGSYTIVADAGTFTHTGAAAGLYASRKIVSESGSFTLTGASVALSKGFSLSAGGGSFGLTGSAVALKASRKMVAASASYALTGSTVALKAGRKLTAGAGSFTLTGIDVTLSYTPGGVDYTLVAGSASFTLTGASVALRKASKLQAASGSFTLTGIDVALTYGSTQIWTPKSPAAGSWIASTPDDSIWTPKTPVTTTWN